MARPKQMGHTEGEPWRQLADRALERIVEDAPEELREAVRHEVAWAALRWFERSTSLESEEDTRTTLELPRPLLRPATLPLVAPALCGGSCGLALPVRHYAATLTPTGVRDLCPACHAELFTTAKGNGSP